MGKSADSIEAKLEMDRPPRGRWFGWGLLLLVMLGVAGGSYWFYAGYAKKSSQVRYETQAVKTGSLTVTVTATGILNPVNEVEVGTEVSGTVRLVAVDYNDRVQAGQLLARLDTDQLESSIVQSRAALTSAKAQLQEAKATEEEAASNLARLHHLHEASDGRVPARQEIDTAEATVKRAKAQVALAHAAIAEADARLQIDEDNLEKASIRSPIDGIVLKRDVELGQTYAASLQTPVLFTLAENLTQMELEVEVDEADVGKVREGQEATFTVDAYPDRQFPAVITQVRYAPTSSEGVVTYGTVLLVDNKDLILRPGMTATAEITVQHIPEATLVANTVFRFAPKETTKKANKGGFAGGLFPRPPARMSNLPKEPVASGKEKALWVLQGGELRQVMVETGATDGQWTEVVAGDLQPGMEAVTDTVD